MACFQPSFASEPPRSACAWPWEPNAAISSSSSSCKACALAPSALRWAIVAAFLLGRVIAAMLVGVKSTDPATFAAVTMVFLAISALASWLPARRAANLDPTKALREQ